MTPASAPSSRERAIFSSEDEVTSTRAPAWAASWTANVETPLPAPSTSTVSPVTRPPRANSARYAVRPASGSAAASSHESRAGFGKTFASGTATSSA